jgi:hypothetical protein
VPGPLRGLRLLNRSRPKSRIALYFSNQAVPAPPLAQPCGWARAVRLGSPSRAVIPTPARPTLPPPCSPPLPRSPPLPELRRLWSRRHLPDLRHSPGGLRSCPRSGIRSDFGDAAGKLVKLKWRFLISMFSSTTAVNVLTASSN